MLYDDYEKILKIAGIFYYVGRYDEHCLTAYTGACSRLYEVDLNILFEYANDFSKWKYYDRNRAFTEILGEKFVW